MVQELASGVQPAIVVAGHGSNSGSSTDALPTNQSASRRQNGVPFCSIIDAVGKHQCFTVRGQAAVWSERGGSVLVCSECRWCEMKIWKYFHLLSSKGWHAVCAVL